LSKGKDAGNSSMTKVFLFCLLFWPAIVTLSVTVSAIRVLLLRLKPER